MKQRWILGGTIALALVAILAGIRLMVHPLLVSSADKVQVTVTLVAPTATSIIFARQFTQQAQNMLTQITSGVHDSTLRAACPAESSQLPYYHYDFVFPHMGSTIATGRVDARGCALIALRYADGATVNYAWETSQHISLWDVLYQLGGVPRPIHMCTNATCS